MHNTLENESSHHPETIEFALQEFQKVDPDIFFVTKEGSKVFTHKILLSMYSNIFKSMLTGFSFSELLGISLPSASAPDLLILIQILSEGVAFAPDSQTLLKVGKLARLLGITLQGMELGKRGPMISETSEKDVKVTKTEDSLLVLSIEDNEGFLSENEVEEALEQPERKKLTLDEDTEVLVEHGKKIHNKKFKSDNKKEIGKSKNSTECDKTFKTRKTLETHVTKHRGKKRGLQTSSQQFPKICNLCEKELNSHSSLRNHMMIHTGDKPYKCDVCGKVYRRIGRMKSCQLLHAGELRSEPYTCEKCGKVMSSKNILQKHMVRIHSEVKPHECEFCRKSFARHSMLEEHKIGHSEVKQFECFNCARKFSRKNGLKKHQMYYCK